MMLSASIVAAMTFLPNLHSPLVTAGQRRAVQPKMIGELAELSSALPPDAFGAGPTAFASMPREMAEFAVAPQPKFSHTFLTAIGAYTVLSGACTFLPIIQDRLAGSPRGISKMKTYLSSLPESSFGWLTADLRNPLPPLEDLDEFPIGLRDGRRVYLCRIQPDDAHYHGLRYASIEVSKDFTEHYGERVYICQYGDTTSYTRAES